MLSLFPDQQSTNGYSSHRLYMPTLGMWLDAVASVEIIHCIARATPTTAHGNFDNVREIPFYRPMAAHPPKPPPEDIMLGLRT